MEIETEIREIVDTLWRSGGGRDVHWCGRACKVYTRVEGGWRMIFQTGLLDYARSEGPSMPAARAPVDD